MSVEFIDTNVLIYAHDGGAGAKHTQAVDLLTRLFEEEARGAEHSGAFGVLLGGDRKAGYQEP